MLTILFNKKIIFLFFTGNFIIKIEYKKIDDIFVLHHTEVPTEHRGQDFGFFIAHVCIEL